VRRRCQKSWYRSGGQNDQALGRSRGGFGTKLHRGFDGLGHPVELLLTGANESDIAQAEALLAGHEPEAVIPTQKARKEQRAIDRHVDRERNVCERFWSKAKQYRRVATRYDKKAQNFLAFVKVAAITVMLK
jgi:transposase